MTIEVVGHVLDLGIRGQNLDGRRQILYSRPHLILARRRIVVVRNHRQGGHAFFATAAATATTTSTTATAASLIARTLPTLGSGSVAGRNPSDQRSHLSLGFGRQSQRGVDLRNGGHGATSAVVVVVVAAAVVAAVTVDEGGAAVAAVISLLFAAFVSR